MSGWLKSKPECPVDSETRQWIEQRWLWLSEQFGAERARSGPVILPAPEFFPDEYSEVGDGPRKMLDRVCGYMGVDPATVELNLYRDDNPVYVGKWRQGTAGLYQEESGKYRIWIEVENLK